VRGRPRESGDCKRMVPGKSDSYKRLEKRPANAGLFIAFDTGRGIITGLLLPLSLSGRRGKGMAGADERDDYFCPRGILHREGAGRSWAINDTSNVSGVE
jgi:hypothetical protein